MIGKIRILVYVLLIVLLPMILLAKTSKYSKNDLSKLADKSIAYSLYWYNGFPEWGNNESFLGIKNTIGKKTRFDVWEMSDPYSSSKYINLVFPAIGAGDNVLRICAVKVDGELCMDHIDGAGKIDISGGGARGKLIFKSVTTVIGNISWLDLIKDKGKLAPETIAQLKKHFLKVFLSDPTDASGKELDHFFVGPFDRNSCFESYLIVYWKEKKKIYYYPVSPAIYGEPGKRDFCISPTESTLQNELVDENDNQSLKRLRDNCVSDGTLIEINH